MDLHRYNMLLLRFCDEAGLGEAASMLRSGQIRVDGVDMALYYDQDLMNGRVSIQADLGRLPEHAWLPHSLLIRNHASGTGDWCAFGIDPDVDHVIVTFQMFLHAETNITDFAAMLRRCADMAKEWLGRS